MMMRFDDSFQEFECDSGETILITNRCSKLWYNLTADYMRRSLDGDWIIPAKRCWWVRRPYAIPTSTGVMLFGLSKQDLRKLQDSIGALMRLWFPWSGFKADAGFRVAFTNTARECWDDQSDSEIQSWIAGSAQ